jgi:carbonic anhydrase/acetyltransferase-like protein (isoleucine patch superfamily)
MLIQHQGVGPHIHPTACIAPTATICGDVVIGSQCRVMHGATIIAEGGQIRIGEYGIIFENAVLRSNPNHSLTIGNHCLIGPNAHVVGCTVEDSVFIATGAAIFHSAVLETGSEVRIHGVVHLKSRLCAGDTVPIGWVAVGDPARIFPPDQHDAIWEIQKPLNFPLTAYGFERDEADMERITRRLAESLGTHAEDVVLAEYTDDKDLAVC